MSYQAFSPKQKRVLSWWVPGKETAELEAIVCDGAVRSGKTLAMGLGIFISLLENYFFSVGKSNFRSRAILDDFLVRF